MKRTTLLLTVGLTIGAATALGAHASAGGALGTGNKIMSPSYLSQTMGLRLITPTTEVRGPKKWDAQVVDAERFASRGFPDAKVNDRVTIVALGDKRGTVKHDKSGKAHVFNVKDDGAIERE